MLEDWGFIPGRVEAFLSPTGPNRLWRPPTREADRHFHLLRSATPPLSHSPSWRGAYLRAGTILLLSP
jgi:hypothetical protein